MLDYQEKLKPYIEQGLKFVNIKLTDSNYSQILSSHLKPGDCLIDLSTFLDTIMIVKWCAEHGILNINTAINGWDDSWDLDFSSIDSTLNTRHHHMNNLIQQVKQKKAPTIILEHGANPGLVSHLVKKGLIDMSYHLREQKKLPSSVFDFIKDNAFPELAQALGVKVIHISEKDTQISQFPKKSNQFINTWSVDGLFGESLCPAELGWGSHEKIIPAQGAHFDIGNKNCVYLKKSGKNVKVKSWVPNESFIGMVITHGEAISINDYLTINNNGQTIYCPTVHYAYCPTDHTILSMQELEHRSLALQSDIRIMNDEIIEGQDKLGVLLMGNPHISWWTGSLLDIHSARQLVPNQSATTLQVAGAMVAAIDWMIKNPEEGIHYPDTLPWEPITKLAEPYWGGYHSVATNWHPNHLKISPFDKPKDNDWIFQNFLVGG